MNFQIKYLLLFLILPNIIVSQTVEHNLEKYWYYRDRLEQHYMIVGNPELSGTNWPAERLFFSNRKMLGSGENPTHPFSDYLCVLATEYRLLKNYGQGAAATQTLQKIAWALQSFDRTDLNAEKFFRARLANPPLPDDAEDFWQRIDNYIHPTEDLNGFFLRGDVDGQCLMTNGWCIRKPDSAYYPENPEANLLNYNNGQLKQSPFSGITVEHTECLLNNRGIVKTNNRTVESQDEVWGLLLGLAFVNKLVDDPKTFQDLEGNYVTVRKWAKNITWRVVRALSYCPVLDCDGEATPRHWRIQNPVTKELVIQKNGGVTIPFSYLYADAGNKICGDGYPNLQTVKSLQTFPMLFVLLDEDYLLRNLTEGKFNYGLFNLLLISGKKNLGSYYRLYGLSSAFLLITSHERLPAIYSILNDEDIKEELGETEYNTFKNNFLYILNRAPDCGSWIKKMPEQISEVSEPFWYKNRNGDINPIYSNPESLINYDSRYTNGLDYMFLHNLYWLLFMTPSDIVDLTINFPFNGIGTFDNPLTIEEDYIEASNHINTGADVTYKAKYSVRLKKGFRVYNNAKFKALTLGNISSTPVYSYHYFHPECQLEYNLSEKSCEDFDSVYSDITENEDTTEFNDFYSNIFSQEKKCLISPNPFTNTVFISFSSSFWERNINVYIYNIEGVKVFEKYNISQYETLNTTNFKKGMYILRVQKNNELLTYKIIKQ